jgi:hypothetical protein
MRTSISEIFLTIGISVLSVVIDCMELLLSFAMDLTEQFSGPEPIAVESQGTNHGRGDFSLASEHIYEAISGSGPNLGFPPGAIESNAKAISIEERRGFGNFE